MVKPSSRIFERVGLRLFSFIESYWIAILSFFLLIVLFVATENWNWQFWSERTYDAKGNIKEIKTEILKIIQQVALLFLGVIGLGLAIWRSLTAHRQAEAAIRQANIGLKQVEIVERSQYVERYANAARMLDSEKLAVRQAGVYSLRELASIDDSYRNMSVELLASFIRSRSFEELKVAEQKLENLGRTPSDIVDALLSICRSHNNAQLVLDDASFVDITLESLDLKNFSLKDSYWRDLHLIALSFPGFVADNEFNTLSLDRCEFEQTHLYRCRANDVDFSGVNSERSSSKIRWWVCF